MYSQQKKRFRENSSPGNTGPNYVTANEDEQHNNTIPLLVSDIFLTSLRNVRLLKICRFVCKSWNIPASESLRICSVVRLKEGEPKLSKFRDLLLRRSFGVLQQLPCPFQNFNLEGLTFTDPIFINIVLLPNICITDLQIMLDNTVTMLDQTNLDLVLAANKANITNLTVNGNEGFNLNERLSTKDEIRLTALKSLKFQDSCNHCKHIPFMRNILSLCKPEKVDLIVRDENLMISLLPQNQVSDLKCLRINVCALSTEAWKHVGNLKFSRIKSVTFTGKYRDNVPEQRQQWCLFCQNVSPFVEDLGISLPLNTDSELRFPNLKTIKLPSYNALSSFTPDRFPSLVNVLYMVLSPMISTPVRVVVPHHGVHSVIIGVSPLNVNTSLDRGLMDWLTYVKRQFPKVFQLGLKFMKFSPTTFIDIWEVFPRLEKINLDGNCDFLTFSGMELSMVTKYLELGWAVQEIPRRKSIIDFTELKTINFGPKFVVGPDMIIHCLPRVSKLKQIHFHWNESLSVPVLRDSLNHLEKIVILNSTESKFQAQMAQVLDMLPNAYLQ